MADGNKKFEAKSEKCIFKLYLCFLEDSIKKINMASLISSRNPFVLGEGRREKQQYFLLPILKVPSPTAILIVK